MSSNFQRESKMGYLQHYNDALAHYGVLGMKWGQRRENRLYNKIKRNAVKNMQIQKRINDLNIRKLALYGTPSYKHQSKRYDDRIDRMHDKLVRKTNQNQQRTAKLLALEKRNSGSAKSKYTSERMYDYLINQEVFRQMTKQDMMMRYLAKKKGVVLVSGN